MVLTQIALVSRIQFLVVSSNSSSIIKSLSPIDADEQLEITLELSQEFINVAGSSGFYDTFKSVCIDPYFIWF